MFTNLPNMDFDIVRHVQADINHLQKDTSFRN